MECNESSNSSTVLGVSCVNEFDLAWFGEDDDEEPLEGLAVTVAASPLVMTVMLLLLEVELELVLRS